MIMRCLHVAGTLITYWQRLEKLLGSLAYNRPIANLRQLFHNVGAKEKFLRRTFLRKTQITVNR